MARPSSDPLPLDALTGLLDAFERTPLVALGERHTLQELADFVIALLHHPRFPETVQAIVVEFGNARYQTLMDRFLSGETIANRDLRPVWRDAFSWAGTDAPIYEQFFRTVRAINRTHSPARHIRVFLGDPPIDWRTVQDWRDIHPFLERDRHFASVIEQNILPYAQSALLLGGISHFVRTPPNSVSSRANVVDLLDTDHPGLTSVIVPHVGFSHRNAELEPRLASWSIPSLAWVQENWLGELDPRLLFAAGLPVEEGARYAGWRLSDVADGYLYLGPRATLTRSLPNPALYRGDADYLTELERRRSLFYTSNRLEELFVEGNPQYHQPGEAGPAHKIILE